MMHRPRSRLLGSGILLLFAATLALAACNSSSGTSQKAPGAGNTVTGAETRAPANPSGTSTLAEAMAARLNNPR
jgi:ABC-type oligopeptide transport system substrate-binding subunit